MVTYRHTKGLSGSRQGVCERHTAAEWRAGAEVRSQNSKLRVKVRVKTKLEPQSALRKIAENAEKIGIRRLKAMDWSVRPAEDYFGVEEGAGHAGGDGDQFPLAAEDFDLAGAGKFGEIDGASVADAGSGEFVGGDGREVGQQFAGMDEQIL